MGHDSSPKLAVHSTYLPSPFLSTEGLQLLRASMKSSQFRAGTWMSSLLKSIMVFLTASGVVQVAGVYLPAELATQNWAFCMRWRGMQAAFLMRTARSLPLYPSVSSVSFYRSLALIVVPFDLLMPPLRMPDRAAGSGSEMQIRRQKRRRMAASRDHGMLVAPRMRTPVSSWPTPCICTRNSVMTLLEASLADSSLLPHILSISSIKMMEGLVSLAIVKSALISFSDQPTYFEIRSDEEIEQNWALASVAQAFAKKVFPVPGGPYIRMPFQGFIRPSLNISGNLIGRMTASFSAVLASSRPDTSDHFTSGFSWTIAPERAFLYSSSPSSSPPLLPPPLLGAGLPPPPPLVLVTFFFFFILSSICSREVLMSSARPFLFLMQLSLRQVSCSMRQSYTQMPFLRMTMATQQLPSAHSRLPRSTYPLALRSQSARLLTFINQICEFIGHGLCRADEIWNYRLSLMTHAPH